MHSRQQIVDFCDNAEIEVLLLPEEYDVAIIGLSCKFNEYSVVYDSRKCISVLRDFHEMTHDEAIEYYEFNVIGSYVGPNTPTFMVDIV